MWSSADWEWLRTELRAAAGAFGDQLRTVRNTSVQVPNLDWTVAELGAHLASMPELYRAQHALGTEFVPPDDWAAFSNRSRAHITTTDAAELSALVVSGVDELVEPDDPNETRLLYGRETNVGNTAAGMLTECVLHGHDLGRLTGEAPSLTRRQALAGLEQQMCLTPVFVDAGKAAKIAGVYGLRFRGGSDFTFRINDSGELTVERAWPDRADARLNADPATYLASSLGRANPAVAGLRGKIVAYGRKPWRFVALGKVAVDGV